MMNSFASEGEATEESTGVGGTDADVLAAEYNGVGLEGSLDGGAMGNVKESLFAFRVAGEVDRDSRVGEQSPPEGIGGGGMAVASEPRLRPPVSPSSPSS